jgi:hypothetical protein
MAKKAKDTGPVVLDHCAACQGVECGTVRVPVCCGECTHGQDDEPVAAG